MKQNEEIDECIDKLESFFSGAGIHPSIGIKAMMKLIGRTYIHNKSNYGKLNQLMFSMYCKEILGSIKDVE
jgi:hypothetical protein